MIFNRKKPLTLLSLQSPAPATPPAVRKPSSPPPVRVKPAPDPLIKPAAAQILTDGPAKDFDVEIARVLDALQQLLHSEVKNTEPHITDTREKGLEGIFGRKAQGAAAGRSGK